MKFSIIIPVYNAGAYLRDCILSVLRASEKTQSKVEVICVNDGSTDNSLEILSEYRESISIFNQKNSGVGAARNLGLENASGDWIWFVDADDVIHPFALKYLEDEICFLDKIPQAVFFNLHHGLDAFNELTRHVKKFDLNEQNQDKVWRTPAYTLFRRDLIGDIRFKKYKIAEDVVFTLTYLSRYPSDWYETDEILYFYRQHVDSASGYKPSAAFIKEWLESSNYIIDLMQKVFASTTFCVSWFKLQLICTPKWSLFKIPLSESRQFIKPYCDNVLKYGAWRPMSAKWRIVFWALHICPSALLARVLIYYRYMIKSNNRVA